jgi:hypothetical protein
MRYIRSREHLLQPPNRHAKTGSRVRLSGNAIRSEELDAALFGIAWRRQVLNATLADQKIAASFAAAV